MKKRIMVVVLLLITVFFNITTAFAFSDDYMEDYVPSSGYYIVDYADIINLSTATYIVDLNEALANYSESMRIVVVSDYYMKDPYTNAQQIIEDYGVGGPDAFNGMVLFFTTKDDEVLLFTGEAISNEFPQETANEYIDNYFRKHFEDGDYSTAITTLLNELHKWYEGYFNTTFHIIDDHHAHLYAIKEGPTYRWDVPSTYMPLVLFVVGFIGIGVYLWFQSRSHVPNYDGRNFLGGSVSDDYGYTYYHSSYHSSGHIHSSGSGGSSFSGRGSGGGGRSGGGGGGRR